MSSEQNRQPNATRNLAASLLAVASLACLFPGLLLPFVRLTSFLDDRVLSIIETIGELFRDGRIFLAAIILVFSVLFPLIKPLIVITALSTSVPVNMAVRANLLNWAEKTARWSMADVLVLALLIVGMKVQGLVALELQSGTYFFMAAVFLSLGAGAFVSIPKGKSMEAGMTRKSGGMQGRVNKNLPIAGGILVLAGLSAVLFSGGGAVDDVLIEEKGGIDLGEIRNLVDSPDYYLVIRTSAGATETEVQEEPIGNGLRFVLEDSIAIDSIRSIDVMDKNLNVETGIGKIGLPDRKMDRVEVRGRRSLKGSKFLIHLQGSESVLSIIGWVLAGIGGVLLAGTGLMMLAQNIVGTDKPVVPAEEKEEI